MTLDAQAQVARLSGRYTIPPPFARHRPASSAPALANLDWNLDLFGRQRAAIERRARVGARRRRSTSRRRGWRSPASVAQTYLDLARAEAQAAIARAHDRDARRLAAAGRRAHPQPARQQARRDRPPRRCSRRRAGALVARRGRSARSRATRWRRWPGAGPIMPPRSRPTALRLDAGLPLPAAVPADLLARRADIAAAQARIDAAAAGRQVARRAFYPNINLAALAGLQAIGLGNLLSLDAGHGRRRRRRSTCRCSTTAGCSADLAGATAALDLATADYNDRVVGAVREAADAIALVGNLARRSAPRQREVVRGFAETGRLNGVRVRSGLDSRLDLVDNDVRLLDAELADANLAADARARPRRGSCWRSAAASPPAPGTRPMTDTASPPPPSRRAAAPRGNPRGAPALAS